MPSLPRHRSEVVDGDIGKASYSLALGRSLITIEPGDFICYHAPWDGEEYDT